MSIETLSPAAIAAELGARLKQARLNADKTQVEVAERAGVTRKAVLNAEKGKAQLEVMIAILGALKLTAQLDNFLPPQDISPVQLARLQGRKRQRASGQRAATGQEPPEW
ncbi:MAG: helix-turn-helix transcriptional regulator [Halioglobus sp.]|nr:helix-turn-helix transcriptional regulator [Halioglobus sp.]